MSDRPERPELVRELAVQLRLLGIASQQVADRFAQTHELSASTFRALALVYEHDRNGAPLTARGLATAMSVTPAAVTYTVDRLVTSGHVVREPDPHDRRRVLLRFAPHGHEVAAAFFGPLAIAHSTALAGYDDDQLRLCARMLADVTATLERFDEPSPGMATGTSASLDARRDDTDDH